VYSLSQYFNSIDNGQYAQAYAQLGPDQQATQTEAQFASGMTSTQDSNINITSAAPSGTGYLVSVTFTSNQNASTGPNGDTCDNWTLQYTMTDAASTMLIDGATGQHASC
jgi:hypothetical protein